MKNIFRYFLFPFSVLYGLVVRFRNRLYDKETFRSVAFDLPVICVGNLSVGGTGKTPMVEYLIRLLAPHHNVGVLSRGYRRKTKGFVVANNTMSAEDVGDEPLQIFLNHPDTTVAVAEMRVIGIPMILQHRPEVNLIILDDALQHREVRAGLNILLTSWQRPYTRDYLLPAGNLRDTRSSSNRAEIIVVTKCNPDITVDEQQGLIREIGPSEKQSVFFAANSYGTPRHFTTGKKYPLHRDVHVLLVCGIAAPAPLQDALRGMASLDESIIFKDHHHYTAGDVRKMKQRFDRMAGREKIIITTEKDAVKFRSIQAQIGDLPVYVLPVEHQFLFNEGARFDKLVRDFAKQFGQEGA